MILQYFKKKENKEQIIAAKQYKKIISESNIGPSCVFDVNVSSFINEKFRSIICYKFPCYDAVLYYRYYNVHRK